MNKGTFAAFYKVIESADFAIVILEFAALADQEATRELNADTNPELASVSLGAECR